MAKSKGYHAKSKGYPPDTRLGQDIFGQYRQGGKIMQKKRPRPLPRKMKKKQGSPSVSESSSTQEQKLEQDQWKKQYEDLNRKHQFLLAEYANYKRQNFKQMENFRKYEGQHLILSLVDKMMDPFDLALQQDLTEKNKESFKKGIQMIYDNMKSFLKEAGVRESTQKGEPFNPAFHNALDSVPTGDMPPDHILHIIKKAYFFHDKLIRPAEVIVSRQNTVPTQENQTQENKNGEPSRDRA